MEEKPFFVFTNTFILYWFFVWVALALTVALPISNKYFEPKLNICRFYFTNSSTVEFANTWTNRGYDYFLKSGHELSVEHACMCNGWHLSHFFVHFVCALLFPQYWKEQIVISIVFECIEYPICHDTTDIWFNTLGMILGLTVSKATKFLN